MVACSRLLGLVAACLVAGGCRFGFDERMDAPDDTARPIAPVAIAPGRFSTTSTTFVDVPGSVITIPPSPGTSWLLVVSAALQSSSLSFDAVEARYLVDGVERGMGGTESIELDRPGPWQHFYVFEGTDTPAEIRFQLRDALGATAVIDQLHAVVAPLPATATPMYASSDPIMPITSMTPTPAATLQLTTPVGGDHLVFLLVNATEAPGASDIDFQWFDPAGQPWHSAMLKNPRGAWQSTMMIRRTTLAAGPSSIVLQASTRAMAQLQYVRALALPTAAFPGLVASSENTTKQSTVAATRLTTNELQPMLASAPAYLAIGTMQVDDDCANALLATRGAHFVIDGEEQVAVHAAGNCAYETTYGAVRLMTSAPAYFAAGVSSGNAQNVEHRESTLVVLGLP